MNVLEKEGGRGTSQQAHTMPYSNSLSKCLQQLELAQAAAGSQELGPTLSPATSEGVHQEEVEIRNTVGTRTQACCYRGWAPHTASPSTHPVVAFNIRL